MGLLSDTCLGIWSRAGETVVARVTAFGSRRVPGVGLGRRDERCAEFLWISSAAPGSEVKERMTVAVLGFLVSA